MHTNFSYDAVVGKENMFSKNNKSPGGESVHEVVVQLRTNSMEFNKAIVVVRVR